MLRRLSDFDEIVINADTGAITTGGEPFELESIPFDQANDLLGPPAAGTADPTIEDVSAVPVPR